MGSGTSSIQHHQQQQRNAAYLVQPNYNNTNNTNVNQLQQNQLYQQQMQQNQIHQQQIQQQQLRQQQLIQQQAEQQRQQQIAGIFLHLAFNSISSWQIVHSTSGVFILSVGTTLAHQRKLNKYSCKYIIIIK